MQVWVNSGLVDEAAAAVSAFDHGLTVGDGVFETVKVTDGRTFALTRHLERLGRSAAAIGLPPPDAATVRHAAEAVVAANPFSGMGRLRITYTGGRAPLGSERGDSEPTLLAAVAPQPAPAPTVDVATVPWPRNERGALAGVKSTSYAENVKALAYAKEHGGSEAIFGNIAGNLCEGTGSNIFVVVHGTLVTPPLAAGCLAGVTRALVLDWVGAEERDLPLSDLPAVEEAFLSGTTRDVQPIRAIDGTALAAAPGPVTAKAMEVFAARATEDLDP